MQFSILALSARRVRRSGVLLLALASACATGTQLEGVADTWTYDGHERTAEGQAVVVSAHPEASAVGRAVLEAGGNAVDAAVAVGFALAVVHPSAGNIGGGGFMMYRDTSGQVFALDFRETAPTGATRDMYLDADGNPTDLSVTGHLSAGVPGSVAGLAEAHRRFGRIPWADLVAPAVRLAGSGFLVDEHRSRSIASDSARLSRVPASAASFLPGGRPPAPGDTLRQLDLAVTLSLIRDLGPEGFYRGLIADLIVAEMARGGGLITHQDLIDYRAVWRDPVRIDYRGHTLFSMPPASSGGLTLGLILNILEGYDPLPGYGTPELLHLEAEAMRRAFTDRNRWMGDPDFVEMPIVQLTSKDYAAELRAGIDPAAATPTPPFEPVPEGVHTTHYSVVDAEGNAVAVTTTINNSYGSAVTVTGAGFLLNDEMDDFTSAPGKPNMYGLVQGEANAIVPGKRMLSAMTPTIVLDPDGKLLMVVGTPGGPTIITQVYHVISNVIDHGMSLPDAVAAPRMHHQALPDQIQVEGDAFLPEVLDALRSRGHEIRDRGRMGDIHAIIRTPRGWLGVSDPRGGGGGAAY